MSQTAPEQLARLEPESRAALEEMLKVLPGGLQALPIPERRVALAAISKHLSASIPPSEDVIVEDRTIPGPSGAPEIPIRVYRPQTVSDAHPAILYIHGGGMVVGDLETGDMGCRTFCAQLGALVVNIEYRLAPEYPYPAPVEDCYAGLTWMTDHARSLGIDSNRIAIYGESAGGGLTIGTALMALDREGPRPCFVMAIYPMLDDRNITPSSHQITAIGVWDRAANMEAWDAYLGGQEADHYAAPSRRTDATGFPPTFIDVGTEDAFRDEDIAFASTLLASGVPTELHVYPGAFHGSEQLAPMSPLNQRILHRRLEALAEKLS
ncbi:MAG: alpha/beta hydrolase [Bacteroidota bacterium]